MAAKAWLAVALCSTGGVLAQTPELSERIRRLEEQNQALQKQLQEQQGVIQALTSRLGEVERAAPMSAEAMGEKPRGGFELGKVHLGVAGAVGVMAGGSASPFRDVDFRMDEARLLVEAPVWDDTYLYSEVFLTFRESNVEAACVGELYLDFENLSRVVDLDGWLSLRLGRFNIPFGEEYQTRYALQNPLISHSLSDLWGIDEGVELYGRVGKVSYVVAVQNGGHPMLHDYDHDKAVAARLSFDPRPWLHFSGSVMRTGALNSVDDKFSEMWFGNGFFKRLGGSGAPTFDVRLAELDARVRWPGGYLHGAGGVARYGDTDPVTDYGRDAWYYYVEATQNLAGRLFGAARFSQISARKGLPLVGNADFGAFMFGPLTKDLWRLSLGMGYRFGDSMVLKVEHSLEQGHLLNGARRRGQDLTGIQVGFQF